MKARIVNKVRKLCSVYACRHAGVNPNCKGVRFTECMKCLHYLASVRVMRKVRDHIKFVQRYDNGVKKVYICGKDLVEKLNHLEVVEVWPDTGEHTPQELCTKSTVKSEGNNNNEREPNLRRLLAPYRRNPFCPEAKKIYKDYVAHKKS